VVGGTDPMRSQRTYETPPEGTVDHFVIGGTAAALLTGAFALRGLAILIVSVSAAWSRNKGKRDSAVDALRVLRAPRLPRSGPKPG
jgi:hypothetical protein